MGLQADSSTRADAATLSTLEPAMTALLAVVLLGESLAPPTSLINSRLGRPI
jgi:drug/metabolite transporter (DMT)-like permease